MSQVRNSVQKQITKVGQQLGSLVAQKSSQRGQLLLTDGKSKTKKKVKSKKTIRGGMLQGLGTSVKQTIAPIAYGLQTAARGNSHTPFIVSGFGTFGQVYVGATANSCYFWNASGVATNTNRVSVDPAGSSTTAGNYLCLQAAIRSVCLSFVRYRWRKFIIHYIPVVSTGTAGSLVMGFTPEVVTTSSTSNQPEEVSCFERGFSTPVWQTISYDALGPNGIDSQWYYMDPSSAIDESNLRQESAGSIFFGYFGTPPINTATGVLKFEYSIELEGLANTGLFVNMTDDEPKTKLEIDCASTSSNETGKSLLGQHNPPPSPETEYYPVPRDRRYIPTL